MLLMKCCTQAMLALPRFSEGARRPRLRVRVCARACAHEGLS